jgi:foldase protein PrsA
MQVRIWWLALGAAVAFAGCGGSAATSNIVVSSGSGADVINADGKSITTGAIGHWMQVAVASETGATGAPKPVVPDPPNYTACIASAKAQSKPAKKHKASTEAELKKQCEQQYKTLQREAAGFLISSEWLLGEASSLGVSVSDAEVKAKLEKSFSHPGELQKYLSSSRQTLSDALLRMKLSLLTAKIKQRVVEEKEKGQIAKYYKENISQFSTGEKRGLLMIQTNTKAQAEKAKREIASGKSFESVATRVSIEPEARHTGGRLPGVVKGFYVEPVNKAVFAAKKGVLTGPIKSPDRYWLFEVQSMASGSRQTLEQAEPTIKRQIASTEQESAIREFATEFTKKWKAKTECHQGYVVEDCKGYKPPEEVPTSATTATTPTSSATSSPKKK